MNHILEKFAREWIRINLSRCSEKEIDVFRRLYAFNLPGVDTTTLSQNIEKEKLSWAMVQIENTLNEKEIKPLWPIEFGDMLVLLSKSSKNPGE